MMGQTERFCPADRKLYALRDVTGTVPSIPLITASIMSKKMAESLERLVLDVKYGSGAFMKTREEAEVLARSMEMVGVEMGVEVTSVLNEMNEPLGKAVGNALEVLEALDCLRGGGPNDLRELVLDLSEKIAGVSREKLEELLDTGVAMRKFEDMVEAQGGRVEELDLLSEIHSAAVVCEVLSKASGTIGSVDAGLIGQASLELGAGRARAEHSVDFAVGFDCLVKCGEEVNSGDVLARIHARTEEAARSAQRAVEEAIAFACEG